ncbi:MAG: Rne/Rng family ribonuclease [Rhodospirillaceae bacterium]|nr:Rne/Rng family ribonuclease [Rhodospirillaceae bacterium]
MSTNRMIIDAAHPEETRVAVLSGNRLQDFDVESVTRKQIKGNIYLAKVIRVEPSLQAAFVDYGGNRQGFLSFSEIHPDYYQIPIEDRQALLAAQEAAAIEDEASEDNAGEAPAEDEAEQPDEPVEEAAAGLAATADEGANDNVNDDGDEEVGAPKPSRKGVETLGGDDSEDARPKRRVLNYRNYKIQEVIKRRQILLIQVVKEERGNKGAALTTYISLAGRYCVLMPNTARGGGISRKITNGADRKHLKTILTGLKIPEGMAVIVRTAGTKRSKAEIKRDYEYLVRLWDSVRDLTLESTAPSLVHEEGNLIKRSIRDLYTGDISEIIVAGEAGYRLAKDFIKLLIPSHAKRVQPYSESTEPIFQNYQVESQLDAIHSPEVQMKSGAYIVINPTEALVSIDVNSGRSTRERNIEETAFKTNLEAAEEIARQLRLRDLAGLIVIDFIDMDVTRNNTQVEKRLKDAMRNDRARIQIGRISPFGLLELSRQRLRMSLIETSSEPCPYCGGTGIRRSTDSAALVALRAIQEEANRKHAKELIVHVPTAVALYILNQKRPALTSIEQDTDISIVVTADESLIPPDLRIERVGASGKIEAVSPNVIAGDTKADEKPSKRRRRPRRRNSSDGEARTKEGQDATASEAGSDQVDAAQAVSKDDDSEENKAPKRRRRGKRGGRRRRGRSEEQVASEESSTNSEILTDSDTSSPEIVTAEPETAASEEEKPAKKPARRRSRAKKAAVDSDTPTVNTDDKVAETPVESAAAESVEMAKEEKPKRTRRPRKKASVAKQEDKISEEIDLDPKLVAEAAKTTVINIGNSEPTTKEKPKSGWWRR